MNNDLLEKLIESLKSIRLELHSKVEDSVIHDLDLVIFQLENLPNPGKQSLSRLDMLLILSKVCSQLPSLIKMLDNLFRQE